MVLEGRRPARASLTHVWSLQRHDPGGGPRAGLGDVVKAVRSCLRPTTRPRPRGRHRPTGSPTRGRCASGSNVRSSLARFHATLDQPKDSRRPLLALTRRFLWPREAAPHPRPYRLVDRRRALRAGHGEIALATAVDDHDVDGEREAAIDQLLGDDAALAALGLILANVRKWHTSEEAIGSAYVRS